MTDTLLPLAGDHQLQHQAIARIPWQIVGELTGLANGEAATRDHAFHAALALVLRRFSGNDDLLVHLEAGSAVGVRTVVQDDTTFREAICIVRNACDRADRFITSSDDALFVRVVGPYTCELSGDVSDDVFTVALRSEAVTLPAESTQSVLDALVALIEAAIGAPDRPGDELALTSRDARERLLWRADGPRRPQREGQTLDRIVTEHATRTPNAIAVIDGSASTTYRQLEARAQAIAWALRRRGIVPGNRVGVCADASVDLIAAILGIWAAGAVYVPLDPGVPLDRLAGVEADAAVTLAIVSRAHSERVSSPERIVLDDVVPVSDGVTGSLADPNGGAYILYTSGSTGTPKGVEISHRAAANAILAACDICAFETSDKTLYRTAISFDLSIYDIFCSLAAGGAIVVAPPTAVADPYAIIELIVRNDITHLLLGPSLLALLLDRRSFERCASLRVVTCGGEALSLALCERFFGRSSATLYNLYGPSEATMLVTLHRCTPADLRASEVTAPLGRPLANTHVSVRDAAQWPVPPGAIGEITIGGVQLASGYINRDEETARRFVGDPARPLERLYRTGDLARLRHDGLIVFLGRNDKQIKIRGSRVEPGEVAAVIERVAGVQMAIVCAQRRASSEASDAFVLVAYVKLQPGVTLTSNGLRNALQPLLPTYMIPIDVQFVEAFPLTASGKIDEQALVAGEFHQARIAALAETAPFKNEFSLRGIAREQVRMIWEKLLGRSDIGDYDDFFDAGGDSLLAVRLMMQLEESFGHRVALADFFETMTIAALAELVAADCVPVERDAVTLNESGSKPPFVYLHGDFAGGSYAWSLASLLGVDQPITVVAPHGLRGRSPATTVPQMAADVVAMVNRLHPVGPVRIGGYSAAGLVAYEAARQLQSAGRVVLDVMLVGTTAEKRVFARLGAVVGWLPMPATYRRSILTSAMHIGLRARHVAKMSLWDVWRRMSGGMERTIAVLAPNEVELGQDYSRYVGAHDAYIPANYHGNVTVLAPESEKPDHDRLEFDWRSIAPRTHVVAVPGTHLGCVARHLDEIAEEIRHRFA